MLRRFHEHATCFRRLTTYRGSLVVQFYKIIACARIPPTHFPYLSFSITLFTFSIFMRIVIADTGNISTKYIYIGPEELYVFSFYSKKRAVVYCTAKTRANLFNVIESCVFISIDVLTGENSDYDKCDFCRKFFYRTETNIFACRKIIVDAYCW